MIHRLKYYWGLGYTPSARFPRNMRIAVSVGRSQITPAIQESYRTERIAELAGSHGHPSLGDPPEVDRLELETDGGQVSITVFNRGILFLQAPDDEAQPLDEIRRLHRFFEVVKTELGGA